MSEMSDNEIKCEDCPNKADAREYPLTRCVSCSNKKANEILKSWDVFRKKEVSK